MSKNKKIERYSKKVELTVGSPKRFQPDRRFYFLAVLGMWCLSLWIFQFSTLARFSQVFDVGSDFETFENFSRFLFDPNSLFHLNVWDGLIFTLLIGLPVYMVYLQCRFGVLEETWGMMVNRGWKKVLLLSILFATFCRFALHPGAFPNIGDGTQHLGTVDEFWRSLKMGSFADYSTLFYSGWPPRQYIGNLFAVCAGTFAYVTGSHLGVKIFLFIMHTVSCLGMFLWVEKLTHSRYASLFASIAYGLNYWHLHNIFAIGHFHMSIVYACLPLPFYFFERGLAESKSRLRNFLLCAVPLAGTVYTHFVWGAMLWGLFMIYCVYRLATRLPKMEKSCSFSFLLAFTLQILILAGMISAPFVQKKESVAGDVTRNFDSMFLKRGVDFNKRIHPEVLYQWYNGHWSFQKSQTGERPQDKFFNSYLGLTPLLFAVLGLLGLRRKSGMDSKVLRILLVFMLASLTLVFFYFQLTGIPGLTIFRIFPDHRYQTFLIFFMAAVSAFGVLIWKRQTDATFKGWKKNLWGILPLLLLAVDVGSTSFQIPFGPAERLSESRFFQRYKVESRIYSNKGENVPFYIFLESPYSAAYTGRMPGLKASLLGMPSDLGVQSETGSRQSRFGNIFYEWLDQHSKPPYVFPDRFTLDYFYLNNFRDVILTRGFDRAVDDSQLLNSDIDSEYVFGQLRFHTPIIASSAVEPYEWKNEDDPSELQALYWSMGLDYEHRTAAKIYVQSQGHLEPLPVSGKLNFELTDYHVHPKKYAYHLRLNQPAYVRLSASYYSFLKARIDGQKAAFYPGATYEVVMKVPAGEHIIEIEGGWDPYRKVWLFITWIGFAVLAFLAIRYPSGLRASG